MRYIDAFNHFFPQALWDKMISTPGAAADIGARMRGIPCIYDLNERKRVVDIFRQDKNYSQVISLGMPPLEALGTPEEVETFAKLGNDGMAELVAKHPDYFCGWLASLPMNSKNFTKELERAISLGANGIQIHSNINGKPLDEDEFRPLFEIAEKHNKPVFLHPSRGAFDLPDYKTEKKSKYEIWWTFGWPYETSVAMARLPDNINPAKNSNGSQFYACLKPLPKLDGQYTVFGEVLEGLDVLDFISNQPTNSNDFPLQKIVIKSIVIEPRSATPAHQ